MTERERTQDALLVEMADGLCKLLNPKHPTSAENFADGIANATEAFREASAKQHDEDRNGVRRAMGKADCPEGVTKPMVCGACGSDRFAYVVPGKWQCVKCGGVAESEADTEEESATSA